MMAKRARRKGKGPKDPEAPLDHHTAYGPVAGMGESPNRDAFTVLLYTVGTHLTLTVIKGLYGEGICPLLWGLHLKGLCIHEATCEHCYDHRLMGCRKDIPPTECFARGADRHYCDANDCTICFTDPLEWFYTWDTLGTIEPPDREG